MQVKTHTHNALARPCFTDKRPNMINMYVNILQFVLYKICLYNVSIALYEVDTAQYALDNAQFYRKIPKETKELYMFTSILSRYIPLTFMKTFLIKISKIHEIIITYMYVNILNIFSIKGEIKHSLVCRNVCFRNEHEF